MRTQTLFGLLIAFALLCNVVVNGASAPARAVTVNPTTADLLYHTNFFSRNLNTTDFTFGGTTNNRVKLTTFVQSGSVILSADGTLTNTFTTAYSAAPIVVISSEQTNNAVHLGTITSTNAIFKGITNSVVKWIAVGTR